MDTRSIIVIGASTGGFEALKKLVANLPPDFDGSIFIVWHMSSDVYGILPQVLNRANRIRTAHAYDREPIQPNRIYVAPPDHHMLIEDGHVRVTRGPKENRFRPAIDPLFRSAAYAYGSAVIGVVLSGALDDGTAGLWLIKQQGGTAVVQDPHDAEVASMPASALREVAVDYSVPIADMAQLLVRLHQESSAGPDAGPDAPAREDEKTTRTPDRKHHADTPGQPGQHNHLDRNKLEIRVAANDNAFESGIMTMGDLTPYTCPECHGVLLGFKEGGRLRFRCHTGHAFSATSLLEALTEQIEESLYDAIRGVEESVMLLNHMGDHFAENNHTRLAALYFQKAREAEARSERVRQVILSHEQLNQTSLQQQAEHEPKS